MSSTLAPSERHLHNWILQNPERFAFDDGVTEIYPFIEIVDSEVVLPHGRADIIGTGFKSIVIVELKQGAITEKTIGQLMRYRADIRHLWIKIAFLEEFRGYERITDTELNAWGLPQIDLIAVGHSVETPALFNQSLNNISLIQYRYDGEGYSFDNFPDDRFRVGFDVDALLNTPTARAIHALTWETIHDTLSRSETTCRDAGVDETTVQK